MSRFAISVVFCLALAGCLPPSTKTEDQIPWEQAISILNSGEVASVGQAHSLEVSLLLKDGTAVKTKEPGIDAIFHEVEKCGQKCENLSMVTE